MVKIKLNIIIIIIIIDTHTTISATFPRVVFIFLAQQHCIIKLTSVKLN